MTIDEKIAKVERLIDDHRRQDGTYRPRRPAILTTTDAYTAAVQR